MSAPRRYREHPAPPGKTRAQRRPGHASASAWQPATAPPRRLTADDVMTAREIARLLRTPVSTVEDWARRGILPSVKIGKRRLYIRQNIEAVLIGSGQAAIGAPSGVSAANAAVNACACSDAGRACR
jgi:excisionase family DNA binding protein